MKMIVIRSSAFTAFALCSILMFCSMAPALADEAGGEDVYRVYVHLGFGDETDAQYSFIYKDIVETAFREMEHKSNYRYFKEEADFLAAVENDSPEAIYAGGREHVIRFITEMDYSPFWSYSTYGLDDIASCIYIDENSTVEDVSELRGKTISMNNTAFEYILLRGVSGEPPEEFFSQVDLTKIGPSPAYSMKLESLDAMFLSEQIFTFLEKNNPGIVNTLKKLDCSFKYAFLPLMVRNDVDEKILDGLDRIPPLIASGKIRSKSTAFLKFQKFSKVNVSKEDYRNIIEAYRKAEEEGWIEDYRKWVSSLEE